MQEFFEVWNLQEFNNYTLTLSVIMIAFEIIAGVAVLIGWKMRIFSWLLLDADLILYIPYRIRIILRKNQGMRMLR
jgi:uncharacterized membrane protein YphA (DoxX/SURF4 family)